MKAFDFRSLFDQRRIHYIERGANVKRNEINIKCPWCGNADPSEHLGINLDSGWYSCWRHKQGHSGKSPLRLLMQLLGISYSEARALAGLDEGYIDPEGFDALAARIMGRTGMIAPPPPSTLKLELDPSFMLIENHPLTKRFYDYMWGRYFDDVEALAKKYRLCADRKGSRVIMPYTLEGRLVTWTGRAISRSSVRYLDLGKDESIVPVKENVYLFDEAKQGGRVLCVVEGQIDALKIDFYGAEFGVHAVALATNSINPEQIYMLEELAEQFDEVRVVMDTKTTFGYVDSMRLKEELRTLKSTLTIGETPYGRSDPGELRPTEARTWAIAMSSGKHIEWRAA